jgi:hypothetical protein
VICLVLETRLSQSTKPVTSLFDEILLFGRISLREELIVCLPERAAHPLASLLEVGRTEVCFS